MSERKVVFSPSDGVEQMKEECDSLLSRVFDIEWAFVSDESRVSDFVPMHVDSMEREDNVRIAYEKIREVYGVDVEEKTHPYVIDVLRAISARRMVQ